jgi:hypothetical protein
MRSTFLAGVLEAAVPVPDFLLFRVVIEGVDGEIAPGGVLLLVAEYVVAQQHAVLGGDAGLVLVVLGLGRGGPESGDLDEIGTAVDMHDLEAPADDARATEHPRRTSSGVASVATSKSLGSRPSSRSRTAPPTMKAA